jgi:hypothetical protein
MPVACDVGRLPVPPTSELSLTEASARQEAADLEYMASQTNFIAAYAMANALEDFAHTVTIYYFGTRGRGWPEAKTYDLDMTTTIPNETKLLYAFDAGKVIETSAPHRKKMCALVELVFDERCNEKLP